MCVFAVAPRTFLHLVQYPFPHPHTKCAAKLQKKIHICKYKMHTKAFFLPKWQFLRNLFEYIVDFLMSQNSLHDSKKYIYYVYIVFAQKWRISQSILWWSFGDCLVILWFDSSPRTFLGANTTTYGCEEASDIFWGYIFWISFWSSTSSSLYDLW